MENSGVFIVGVSDCGERVCAAAGRISTMEGTCSEIMAKSLDSEKNSTLINKVTASGHNSTLEHIMFNLAFENVSALFEQFLIEFRLASFTVKSRRYVDFTNMGYYIPKTFSSEDKEIYINHMNSLFSLYSYLVENEIPKEDARFVLPYSLYSNIFCSVNGRELINILFSLLYGRGSENREFQDIGKSLLEAAKEYAPGIFSDFDKRCMVKNELSHTPDLSFLKFDNENKIAENVPLINLISHTSNPEKIICEAALSELGSVYAYDLENILSNEELKSKIIKSVLYSRRPRALEHINYTFKFNNVSLPCLTHFSRHRIWSLSIPPLSTANRERHIMPDEVKKSNSLQSLYNEAFEKNSKIYNSFKEKYNSSDCSYLLLSGNTINFTGTLNGRELLLFMNLRSCNRAQWEIRDFAIEMLEVLRKASPEIFRFYGPSCYTFGTCPEGKLTCGKISEVKNFFEHLC